MSHDDSEKSDLSIAGPVLCIIAAMAAIGHFPMAANGIEQTKQTATVFVPAIQTTAAK